MERITAISLEDDGAFPGGRAHPVLIYRAAFAGDNRNDEALAEDIERTFAAHDWKPEWRYGVYDYHHYHSTAHEVLGCFRGRARVCCGGPHGVEIELARGDVLVLPAGAAHKAIWKSDDFCVVGAYAGGRDYDEIRDDTDARPEAERNIAKVPRPSADPVYGQDGPLLRHWDTER